ncbi:MAG: hypothetical protein ACTSQ8_23505 [Candidatus Helarchaeota archaeon]
MVLRKLSNGELIQIDLHHDKEGRRYATVYGVGFRIKKGSPEEREAHEWAKLLADEIEIITSD